MSRVSVILPTYNRADFLSRSIDSVLDQTFDDFELIVVDDGSTDDTRSVVANYDDDRISYLSQDENSGPSSARNTGIDAASGEFITFLDSDDEFAPTFLETAVGTLQTQPSTCGGTCVTYEDYNPGQNGGSELNPVPPTIGEIKNLRDKTTRVGGLMLPATVISEVGRFDERLPYNEDVDYWIRLFQRGYYLVGIQEPLYRYYKHGDQQTKDNTNKIRGIRTLLRKHDGELPAEYLMERRRDLGMAHADDEDFAEASTEFRRAITHEPGLVTNYWYYATAKLYPPLFEPPNQFVKTFRLYKKLRRELGQKWVKIQ